MILLSHGNLQLLEINLLVFLIIYGLVVNHFFTQPDVLSAFQC